MKSLLATRNRGKVAEIQAVLSDLNVQLICLDDLEPLPEAVEDAPTFKENAREKALFYYGQTKLSTIADDSGLVVDALGGRPGVLSARYAATDTSRIAKLLRELEEVDATEPSSRTARFLCAICMVISRDRLIEVEGSVEGRIVKKPRGRNGFGYDPVFFYTPLNKTFAEISQAEKNDVSHRGEALRKLKARLRSELAE